MNNKAIGMFDSGIGGINVYKEIKKILPQEQIIYLGDTKRFPYGNKTKEEIIQISRENIEFLISKNVKCIVIACGTATSQALDVVSKEYDIPIIGIIMPTIEYVKETAKYNETIGVIATKGSIRSKQWENKLIDNIPNIKIISKATPLLADIAEEGKIDEEESKTIIHEYMKDFENIDRLILGCTHYPLFRRLIENELNNKAEIIDIGINAANFLSKKFKTDGMNADATIKKDIIYLTSIKENLNQYGKILFNRENIEKDFEEEKYKNQVIFKVEI